MAAIRGDRIRHLRQSMGLNQIELAERLGINSYRISRYENEIDNPTLDTLILMVEVFNTSIDYLVGISNTPHPEAEPEPDISAEERELLDLFRAGSDADRQRALRVMRALRDE